MGIVSQNGIELDMLDTCKIVKPGKPYGTMTELKWLAVRFHVKSALCISGMECDCHGDTGKA